MAVSLEARVPLLEYSVVELVWKVPMSLKYRNGKGKWLLREVLYCYVLRELIKVIYRPSTQSLVSES